MTSLWTPEVSELIMEVVLLRLDTMCWCLNALLSYLNNLKCTDFSVCMFVGICRLCRVFSLVLISLSCWHLVVFFFFNHYSYSDVIAFALFIGFIYTVCVSYVFGTQWEKINPVYAYIHLSHCFPNRARCTPGCTSGVAGGIWKGLAAELIWKRHKCDLPLIKG